MVIVGGPSAFALAHQGKACRSGASAVINTANCWACQAQSRPHGQPYVNAGFPGVPASQAGLDVQRRERA
jgi:hypothetical protein